MQGTIFLRTVPYLIQLPSATIQAFGFDCLQWCHWVTSFIQFTRFAARSFLTPCEPSGARPPFCSVPSGNATDALHDIEVDYGARGTAKLPEITVTGGFDRTFDYFEEDATAATAMDVIEKPAGSRHANSSRVKVEIRCGRDKSNIFSLL